MSLEAWGDESPGATQGRETQLFQDLQEIRSKFNRWLAEAARHRKFWSPEDQELAEKIDADLDALSDGMDVKF